MGRKIFSDPFFGFNYRRRVPLQKIIYTMGNHHVYRSINCDTALQIENDLALKKENKDLRLF